ncbi:MAG: hypothetical protein AAFX06_20600 [Planctomycetota bacterium]
MGIFLQIAAIWSSSILPTSPSAPTTTRANVDLVELNHFLDDNGREVVRQLVFYDWCPDQRRFHVRAWRLIKSESQLPRRRWNPTGYLIRWKDKSFTREVWAKSMRETWTQQDPERVNRLVLPENERRPLWESETNQTESERAIVRR